MEVPFEAAKGVAEKVLNVRFPIIMRVFFPGALALGALYVQARQMLRALPSPLDGAWEKLAVVAGVIFGLGVMVSALTNEIYKIYEGRTCWPKRLFDLGVRRQSERVKRLRNEAKKAGSGPKYDELWYELRIYPQDENGDPVAKQPTLLGNILAGYESYPMDRYGMDSVFYWPRIWLTVEKEKKEEIDSQWSVADGFLLLSAVSLLAGLLWMLEAAGKAVDFISFPIPLANEGICFFAGLGWIALGYGLYRLSLSYHRDNGEVFKAIFDLYRDKIRGMMCLDPDDKAAWTAGWAYLQYRVYQPVPCRKCGTLNTFGSKKCKSCAAEMCPPNPDRKSQDKSPTNP
ncbi:MAG TPA: hypothetical protein VJ723_11385 [Candidatus Angelobacter sp.]|nr:hypothetical protein [Candidatus Angelobacter sp.]